MDRGANRVKSFANKFRNLHVTQPVENPDYVLL